MEEQIKAILRHQYPEKYEELHEQTAQRICALLSVVGRSESFVCGHPPKQTYLIDGIWHCEKCGGKWESIANK